MDEARDKKKQREFEGKSVAYYSALVQAWIQTRMERDKTLVTLSGIAIGLMITILTTVGTNSFIELAFYFFSFIGFIVTILVSIRIYKLNSTHIEMVIKGESESVPELRVHDRIAEAGFILGASLLIIIGIMAAANQISGEGGDSMSKGNQTTRTQPIPLNESLEGISRLQPSEIEKSLDGIANLAPQDPQPQQPVAQQGGQGDVQVSEQGEGGQSRKDSPSSTE